MLIVLAIVVSIATSSAYVPEFSEVSFREYYHIGDVSWVEAEFINPDPKVPVFFERGSEPEHGEITLYAEYPLTSSVSRGGRPFICEHLHKIRLIETDDESCEVSYFRLKVNSSERENLQTINFVLQFGFGPRMHIQLIIPMFEVPSLVASKSDEELMRWASMENLRFLGPVDVSNANLNKIADNGPIKIDFSWLSELVTYGIFKTGDVDPSFLGRGVVQSFTTRPIVFREEVIQKFVDFVYPKPDSDSDSDSGREPETKRDSQSVPTTISMIRGDDVTPVSPAFHL